MSRSKATNDVIDVDAQSAGPQIPADMWDKTEQFRDGIVRIRVQCKQSGGGSYRFTGRQRGVTPVGSMSTDELCRIALEFARDHADENPDDGARYRAVYDFQHKNGKITPKYAAIKALWNEEGEIEFDDDDAAVWETEREKVLAASNDDLRQQQREAHSLTMESMRAYTESVARIGEKVESMANGIAGIAASLAESTKGVGEAMAHAGELYRQSQARGVEQDRIALEGRITERELDQADKKWELLTSLTPVAALAVLKQLGVPPEHAATVVAAMTAMQSGGGEGYAGAAMAGSAPGGALAGGAGFPGAGAPPAVAAMHQAAHTAQAQHEAAHAQAAPAQPVSRPAGWQYPGPLDLDDVPGDDMSGAAGLLGCWFAERDEHEERALREVVGGSLYDMLRAAPLKGDRAAGDALRTFGAQVASAGLGALQLLGKIRAAVGADAVGEFQALVTRARSGEI